MLKLQLPDRRMLVTSLNNNNNNGNGNNNEILSQKLWNIRIEFENLFHFSLITFLFPSIKNNWTLLQPYLN